MIDVTSRNPQTTTALSGPPRPPGLCRSAGPALGGAVILAATVAACSSFSGLTGGSAAAPPAPAAATAAPPADGSFTSRVKSFFSGGSGSVGSPASSATAAGSPEIDCPGVAYRQGAATWAVNGPSAENSALSLRYQLSFIQNARECVLTGGNLTIKVGVQGRIVVGPAGGPGTVNVPLRYALVREGTQPQTVWTKFFSVPVTVPQGQLNLAWTHVQEEMTVPRPSADDIENYVIYVGFDPDGTTSRPKPAAKPKTARTR